MLREPAKIFSVQWATRCVLSQPTLRRQHSCKKKLLEKSQAKSQNDSTAPRKKTTASACKSNEGPTYRGISFPSKKISWKSCREAFSRATVVSVGVATVAANLVNPDKALSRKASHLCCKMRLKSGQRFCSGRRQPFARNPQKLRSGRGQNKNTLSTSNASLREISATGRW